MRKLTFALLAAALAGSLDAHPGAAIAVSKGTVYFVDTGGGVFAIEPGGKVVRRDGPAFHWFAFDPASRFVRTPWPYIPGAEFRSAGVNPTLVLSSDYPAAIGADGRFYFARGIGGTEIRIVGIEPSGAESIRATLPPIRARGETVTWLNGLAGAKDGSLYYTEDRAIRKIDARGRRSTVVENVAVSNCSAIPGIGPEFGPYLRGLAIADDGSIYVAASGCGAVLRVDGKGRVTTVLRAQAPWSPTAVTVAGNDVYALEYLHTNSDDRAEWLPRVRKVSRSGEVKVVFTRTRR
jgi:hypothetical protein